MGKRRLNLTFLLSELTSNLTTKKGRKIGVIPQAYINCSQDCVSKTCFQMMLDPSAEDAVGLHLFHKLLH